MNIKRVAAIGCALTLGMWSAGQAQVGASAASGGGMGGVVMPAGDPTWLVVVIAFVVGVGVGFFVARAAGAKSTG